MVNYLDNKKYDRVKSDVKIIPTIIRLLVGGKVSYVIKCEMSLSLKFFFILLLSYFHKIYNNYL